MVQTLQASKVTLGDLVQQFGLRRVSDPQFFPEWQAAAAEISPNDRQRLDQVSANFSYLLEKPPSLESAVKMVVLSPLLELVGFYQPPFWIKTEAGTEISATDEDGTVIKGQTDVLVVSELLWVIAIESKMNNFSLVSALPQTLSYMLASPQFLCFSVITNGSDLVFVKLDRTEPPIYSLSRNFSLLAPGNELVEVLRILKHLGQTTIGR